MTIPTPASSSTPFRARPGLRGAPLVAVLATVASLFFLLAGFASPGVSSAHAASAPAVAEPAVEKITETTATITATIRPEEARTSVYVEYEGAFTAPVAVEAGEAEKTVSFPLAGLKPGTTYSYRVFASNVEGSVQSPEAASPPAQFRTLKPPPPHGEQPWWHATVGSHPTYLHAGAGRDQVQQLTVKATGGKCSETEPEGPEGCFVVVRNESGVLRAKIVHFNASAAQMQAVLEEMYGTGNVTVTGGPGDENGTKPYLIAFGGELGGRELQPLQAYQNGEAGFGHIACVVVGLSCPVKITLNGEESHPGSAEVSVKTSALPDGVLDVAALNVGDAPAEGQCVQVPAGTGRYNSKSCSEVAEEPGTGEFEVSFQITDRLPKGLRAVSVHGVAGQGEGEEPPGTTRHCYLQEGQPGEGQLAVCQHLGPLPAFDQLEMLIGVIVEPGAGSAGAEQQQVRVTGGGAPSYHLSRPLRFGETTPFGVQQYELTPEEEGGLLDTRAGSHPFQSTSTISLNTGRFLASGEAHTGHGEVVLPALVKDLTLHWPAGLVGNPTPFPVCSLSQFLTTGPNEKPLNFCPSQSAVGVSAITYDEPSTFGDFTETVPLFLVEPQQGEPARLGFITPVGPVFIDSSVRNGEDYGVTVHVENITQVPGFFRAETTVWGVPGAPAHDAERGNECLEAARGVAGTVCNPPTPPSNPPPFLSLPSSCPGGPLPSTITADSWQSPGEPTEPFGEPLAQLGGCNQLPFTPSFAAKPEGSAGSTPTALVSDAHVPQGESLNANGLAEGDVRDIEVTLPPGVVVNPASADGLQACSEAQVGFEGFKELDALAERGVQTPTFSPGEASCPDASKLGKATITTPLLPATQPLTGYVYLATPAPNREPGQNPFDSLIAMYILVKDPISGVLAKLPGEVSLNPGTGQITASFSETPQVPFEDAKLEFFGGDRAPLATPARCGSYRASASFTPWSGGEPVPVASPAFNITTGPNGSACPGASLPFSPSLHSSSSNINAGGFTPLQTTISREDGEQDIQQVTLHYPPGVSGLLAGVKLCGEQQANEGTCGPESVVGETIVSVGLGNDPYSVTGGKAYLTGPYHGAPFGLSIVNPAVAGPFDLGEVIVRAKIDVDPRTAQLTVTTNAPGEGFAIPHILDGIPLQIKHVSVNVNRPGFTFNPTSCAPMSITGTITGDEGAGSALETPFQVTNCRELAFTPSIAVTTAGRASKVNGASLRFKIAYPKNAMGSQSNFNEAKFDLPKQLPARLTTIQKACLAATFEANPASCPAHSLIGHAVVHTPVLPVPLEGPVYFVSYGGAKFPEAVLVLHGYGITVDLHGETFIDGKTGITSATFRNTPDVPFESIEVSIPTGPYSEFGANLPAKAHGSFCGQNLVMPTLFKAQNGLEIHQNTRISVTGCPKAKTRAQLLAAALRACHHKHGHKRASCEEGARKAYGARAAKHTKKGKR